MSGSLTQRQMWQDLGLTAVPKEKTDRKKAYCVLKGFWTALKPEEQCAEDTQERIDDQACPRGGNYHPSPRVRRVYFPPTKGYDSSRRRWFARPGIPPTAQYGERRGCSTMPTKGHSDLGSPQVQQERAEPHSPSATSRSGQTESGY